MFNQEEQTIIRSLFQSYSIGNVSKLIAKLKTIKHVDKSTEALTNDIIQKLDSVQDIEKIDLTLALHQEDFNE